MHGRAAPAILGPATRRFARRFADFLAGIAGAAQVVVVDDVRTGCVAVGPPVEPATGLLEAVLPSSATVCRLHRLPPAVAAALAGWASDAVVVVPVVFGHELVAVGLAPVEPDVPVPLRQLDAEAQRVGAGLTWARLVVGARAA